MRYATRRRVGLRWRAMLDRTKPSDYDCRVASNRSSRRFRSRYLDQRESQRCLARLGLSLVLVDPIGTQLDDTMRRQYARQHYTWPAERQAVRRFWGYIYFNMSRFQQAGYDVFGALPAELITHLGGADVQRFTPPPSPGWRQRLRWLRNIIYIRDAFFQALAPSSARPFC